MELTITRPDDWHIHLRDGDLLEAVVPHRFHDLKLLWKGNSHAKSETSHHNHKLPSISDFTPLMTLHLTDTTTANEIKLARKSGVVFAMKLYFAGIFNALVALSLYAKGFEEAGVLGKIKAFISFNGPDFYGLSRNTSKIKLKTTPWKVLETFFYSFGDIILMFAGKTLE
ncbi:dihydroorotase, mitochondrial [Ziziphus jujuba]|uniref:Dihydroorotase, mitochondrial n=1 Tax=Ziziphus jujuba TaxID=326968 RepID=A0A6P4AWK3_ZIZJJ|nr:dihydroorotase, mitochondrial [Ziziphus jujuba]